MILQRHGELRLATTGVKDVLAWNVVIKPFTWFSKLHVVAVLREHLKSMAILVRLRAACHRLVHGFTVLFEFFIDDARKSPLFAGNRICCSPVELSHEFAIGLGASSRHL